VEYQRELQKVAERAEKPALVFAQKNAGRDSKSPTTDTETAL
jgi:hypothetical protein